MGAILGLNQGCRKPTVEEFLAFDTYIFDCDGVIWGINEEDSKEAVAVINGLLGKGKRAMFVTNNSNKGRADFVVELERRGVDFGERSKEEKVAMMVSASYTTANYLKAKGLKRPFVITSDVGVLEELRMAGITEYFATITDDGSTAPAFESAKMKGSPEVAEIIGSRSDVDCVVVGWDLGLTARKVAVAINYIKWHEEVHRGMPDYKDIPIVACAGDAGGVLGTDEFCGDTVKVRAIGNGAMADLIARSFDPPREWIDMGKPSDELLRLLADPDAYNVDMSKTLMVGDTLQTDIVFGNRGGMRTLLVLSGVTTRHELEEQLKYGEYARNPTYVLPKLGTLVDEIMS